MSVNECHHRGALVQHSPTNDHPDVFSCSVFQHCTLEPSNERTFNGLLPNCQNCMVSNQLTPIDCIHRGDIVRADVSNICGSRGDEVNIYRCGKHGECSLRRYCHGQSVIVCLQCNDRQPQTHE